MADISLIFVTLYGLLICIRLQKTRIMDISKLSQKERANLEQLKDRIKGCQLPDSSDEYICKWLSARKFDVDAAEKMLRESLDWRRANQMDRILESWDPPEVLKKYYPVGLCGQDKFGCPIWINAAGRADQRGLLQSATRKDYQRYILYVGEQSLRQMAINGRNLGKAVTQQCAIVDMEGLTMRQLTYKPAMDVGTEMNKVLEANYPETIRRIFIINAPKMFSMVYSVIKALMPASTTEKIILYGNDPGEWKAALSKEIDDDQLPVHYGGKLADPDGNPMYLTKVCMGGQVPTSYYLKKEKLKPRQGMKVVNVSRKSKKKLKFKVDVINSTLRWEFMTVEGDIGFHIYRVQAKEKTDVVPLCRVDSHVFMEDGEIVCTQAATYVIEFDNSFSYLRSKTVHYSIHVEDPVVDPEAIRFNDSVDDEVD